MPGLRRVLVRGALRVPTPRAFGRLRVGSVMLTELFRFFELVTFAGDKSRGRKNQEQVKGFHCAP